MSDRLRRAREAGLELIDVDEYLRTYAGEDESDAEVIAQQTGYGTLRTKLQTAPNALMRALKTTETQVYTSESVARYQAQQLERVAPPARMQALSKRCQVWSRVNTGAVIAGVCSFITAIVSRDITFLLPLIPLAGLLGYGLWRYASSENAYWDLTSWSWANVELKHYREEIPKDIASRIASILRVLPEATFKIAVLSQHYTRHDPDPFLIVCYKGAELVIGAWDEPSYDAEPIG